MVRIEGPLEQLIRKLDDSKLIGADRRGGVSLQFIPEQLAFVVSGFESPSICRWKSLPRIEFILLCILSIIHESYSPLLRVVLTLKAYSLSILRAFSRADSLIDTRARRFVARCKWEIAFIVVHCDHYYS